MRPVKPLSGTAARNNSMRTILHPRKRTKGLREKSSTSRVKTFFLRSRRIQPSLEPFAARVMRNEPRVRRNHPHVRRIGAFASRLLQLAMNFGLRVKSATSCVKSSTSRVRSATSRAEAHHFEDSRRGLTAGCGATSHENNVTAQRRRDFTKRAVDFAGAMRVSSSRLPGSGALSSRRRRGSVRSASWRSR